MPGEGIYIWDDQSLPRLPARSTHTSSPSNACTSNIPLEWPKHQLLSLHQVEAYPEEVEGPAQCCGCIGKICDEIGLPTSEAL